MSAAARHGAASGAALDVRRYVNSGSAPGVAKHDVGAEGRVSSLAQYAAAIPSVRSTT